MADCGLELQPRAGHSDGAELACTSVSQPCGGSWPDLSTWGPRWAQSSWTPASHHEWEPAMVPKVGRETVGWVGPSELGGRSLRCSFCLLQEGTFLGVCWELLYMNRGPEARHIWERRGPSFPRARAGSGFSLTAGGLPCYLVPDALHCHTYPCSSRHDSRARACFGCWLSETVAVWPQRAASSSLPGPRCVPLRGCARPGLTLRLRGKLSRGWHTVTGSVPAEVRFVAGVCQSPSDTSTVATVRVWPRVSGRWRRKVGVQRGP